MQRFPRRPLAALGSVLAMSVLLSGCLYASLAEPFLPSGPETPNLAGNYSDETLSVTLCGVEYPTLAYLTVERVEPYYDDEPFYYRFRADFVIESVNPSYQGLTNYTRWANWEADEVSGHEVTPYGSPFITGFGRVSLEVEGQADEGGITTDTPRLIGTALLVSIPHDCDGTTTTENVNVSFALARD